MTLDPLLLSRIQFAFLIAFHFLLPAFTIGLASYIAVLEGLYLATGSAMYLRISAFWIKIFAVSFGMGVVSGIVMPFQFGTNWSRYSDATADIVAPLMAYEGAHRLLPRGRVPRRAALRAQARAAVGALRRGDHRRGRHAVLARSGSSIANSWMQTPAGFEIVDGRFMPTSWIEVIFNPSFPYRLMHTVVAVYLTTAFTVIGVAAWYPAARPLRRGSRSVMIAMGVLLASILVPLQAVLGDLHGLNTLEHQPQKLAAMEGHLGERRRPAGGAVRAARRGGGDEPRRDLDPEARELLPHARLGRRASRGSRTSRAADRPPVAPVFFGFRVMVGMWASCSR